MFFKGFWRNIDPANWSNTARKWGQNAVKNLPEAPTNIPEIAYKHGRFQTYLRSIYKALVRVMRKSLKQKKLQTTFERVNLNFLLLYL